MDGGRKRRRQEDEMKDHTIKTVMLAAAAAFALLLATAATAGSPGKWSMLATGAGLHSNAQQIALARTPDGTLHVAWKEDSASLDVIHTRSITASGKLGAEATAVSHVPSPSDPALVTTPTGLQLYFAAGAGSPIEGLATSKSTASGTSWSAPVRIVKSSSGLATPAVTLAPDGTSFQAWSGSSIIVHRGLTATAPHVLTVPAGSSNERVNVAADTTGAGIWVAWCRYGGSKTGVIAQRINPATGAPLGAQIQLPGSVTTYQGQPNSTALVSVRALDAGDAVAGVRVKIGQASATTNAKGSAQIAVKLTSRKHRVTARAVRPGYVGAGVRVVVPARSRS
jgi:hypothetical protein